VNTRNGTLQIDFRDLTPIKRGKRDGILVAAVIPLVCVSTTETIRNAAVLVSTFVKYPG